MGYQVTLNIFNPINEIPHSFITISGDGLSQPVTFGYYPNITTVAAPGTIKNDSLTGLGGTPHPTTETYTFDVSAQQALAGLQFAADVAQNPGYYALLGAPSKQNILFPNGYQCTGFARDVLTTMGIQGLTDPEGNPISSSFPATAAAVPMFLGMEYAFTPQDQVAPSTSPLPTPADFNVQVRNLWLGSNAYILSSRVRSTSNASHHGITQ